MGATLYMSPEKGRSQPYDEKDDIFALGCILFELTTMTATHSVAQAGLFNALDKVPEMVEAVRAAHPRFTYYTRSAPRGERVLRNMVSAL